MIMLLTIYCFSAVNFAWQTIPNYNKAALTPTELYNCTSLNKFGCIFLTICLTLINPILAITKFFDWIFHIGRKNNNLNWSNSTSLNGKIAENKYKKTVM